MRIKGRKTRVAETGRRQQLSFDTLGADVMLGSFQATLAHCDRTERREEATVLPSAAPSRRVEQAAWQQMISDALRHTWAFLHAKYKTSTTKRLRVSETISLGEKRFVAIVAVEGREFLIGGGVSGMSLLAQLGTAGAVKSDVGQTFGDSGDTL